MKNSSTNWSKEELKAYVLIYCANADFVESKLEINYIKSKIHAGIYEKMHAEFEKDNDYQSIQKIQTFIKEHNYHSEDKLIREILELFLIDDDFDILEKNLYMGLKHILR